MGGRELHHRIVELYTAIKRLTRAPEVWILSIIQRKLLLPGKYLVHIPCYLVHIPCYLVHVPRYLAHVPCYLVHVPCYLAHVPCYLAHVPCYLVHVCNCTRTCYRKFVCSLDDQYFTIVFAFIIEQFLCIDESTYSTHREAPYCIYQLI